MIFGRSQRICFKRSSDRRNSVWEWNITFELEANFCSLIKTRINRHEIQCFDWFTQSVETLKCLYVYVILLLKFFEHCLLILKKNWGFPLKSSDELKRLKGCVQSHTLWLSLCETVFEETNAFEILWHHF